MRQQMRPAGFEPATHSLEGCCSIQLSYGRSSLVHSKPRTMLFCRAIGAPGFEPGTSCSQSRRATGLRHTPFGAVMKKLTRVMQIIEPVYLLT